MQPNPTADRSESRDPNDTPYNVGSVIRERDGAPSFALTPHADRTGRDAALPKPLRSRQGSINDGVHVRESALVVEASIEVWTEQVRDLRGIAEQLAERAKPRQRLHRTALHCFVGGLPRASLRHQRQEHGLPKVKLARPRQVGSQHVGVDRQTVYERRGPLKHVREHGGGVGANNPFDRRVRDVALVPEGNVFEGRHCGRSNDPSQAAEILASIGLRLGGMALEPF